VLQKVKHCTNDGCIQPDASRNLRIDCERRERKMRLGPRTCQAAPVLFAGGKCPAFIECVNFISTAATIQM
jgi:hypothetical protein